MRLTRSDKDAFVRAVMDDVPQIDYNDMAAGIARDGIRASLPPDVATTLLNYPDYFADFAVALPDGLRNIFVKAAVNHEHSVIKVHMCGLWNELEALAKKNREQNAARNGLRSKVSGAIEGCSTLKQALERLPEFEKYLPKERDGTGVSNLPAIANVVSDLMAAGWPK
jgi:hypothetical protein